MRPTSRACIRVLLVVACLLAPGTWARESHAEESRARAAFALRDTEGVTRRLADYRGTWVVLEWVNFECAPVSELYAAPRRAMQALQRGAMGRGVTWLAISSSAAGQSGHLTPARGKALLAQLGARPTALLLDPTGAVGKAFRVTVTPEVRLVSPQGHVVFAGGVDHLHSVLDAATTGRALPYTTWPVKGCKVPYAAAAPAFSGPKAPDFTLADSRGRRHSLSAYRGKWVVLEWVNYDCPFVKGVYHASHRTTQSLQARCAKAGIVWLSICSSARGKEGQFPSAVANTRMQRLGATPTAYLHDLSGAVGRAYGARYTPEIRIISPEGTIEFAGGFEELRRGRVTQEQLARSAVSRAVGDVLAGRPIAVKKSGAYGCSVKY